MAWVGGESLAGRGRRFRPAPRKKRGMGAGRGEACPAARATPEDPGSRRARALQAACPRAVGARARRPLPASLRASWGAGDRPWRNSGPQATWKLLWLLLGLERGFCDAGQIKMSGIILFDRVIPYDEVSARKGVKMVNS